MNFAQRRREEAAGLSSVSYTHLLPTMDQVKEGIFSAIQFEVEGRTALDLFAGSGQLGICLLYTSRCV